MRILDESFVKSPRSYIVQSILAVIAVLIILAFVEVLTQAAIVAALGASTFIIFAMPHSVVAQPRRLVGGHIVGLVSGLLCYFVFLTGPLDAILGGWKITLWFAGALSVGLSLFLMAITNTEHPPGASTALGIVVQQWSYEVIIFVVVFAVCLAVTRRLLQKFLRDLF